MKFELGGVMQEYLAALTEHWLLPMPENNPAVLQMFADRDAEPHRTLLPWSGEFAGKYLTGAVQVLRVTGDARLKTQLASFVARLVVLQAEDGYLGPYDREHRLNCAPHAHILWQAETWDIWNHYHIMLGLLLWHEDTGDAAALACVEKIADLLVRKFLNTGTRIVDAGGKTYLEMNHGVLHALTLLYQVRPKPVYLALARQIVDEFEDPRAGDFMRVALGGREFHEGPKPRWESLHSIQGLAQLHVITGEARYREALERLWWSIVKLDRHNNGGFSSGERAHGNPYHQAAIETCCTVAWAALSADMLALSGDSIVADELELSTFNQVLGYQHRSGYHCTYNTPMEGIRRKSTDELKFQSLSGSEQVSCCSANAPRGFGLISDWALMEDERGLVVNWYGPATMSARVRGVGVSLEQATEYPRAGAIRLRVNPEQPFAFALALRIPHWSRQSAVRINGAIVPGVKAGIYCRIERTWTAGDVVELSLDLSLHYWRGERECEGRTAIYRGPLLLVLERPGVDVKALAENLPEFDATKMDGVIAAEAGSQAPQFAMDFSTADGERVRLRDYGTAGREETPYVSWLHVKNAPAATFSPRNPLRSARL